MLKIRDRIHHWYKSPWNQASWYMSIHGTIGHICFEIMTIPLYVIIIHKLLCIMASQILFIVYIYIYIFVWVCACIYIWLYMYIYYCTSVCGFVYIFVLQMDKSIYWPVMRLCGISSRCGLSLLICLVTWFGLLFQGGNFLEIGHGEFNFQYKIHAFGRGA